MAEEKWAENILFSLGYYVECKKTSRQVIVHRALQASTNCDFPCFVLRQGPLVSSPSSIGLQLMNREDVQKPLHHGYRLQG